MASVFDDYFYLFLFLNNYAYLQRFFAAYTSVYKNILAYTRRKFYYVKMARTGRPTLYNDDLIAEICSQLAMGKSLNSICKAETMPNIKTIFDWLNKYEDFSNKYVRAKQESADAFAEEIQDISDEKPLTYIDEKGNEKIDPAAVNWHRLRVDSRKWLASKLKPKKYGDKMQLSGDSNAPLVIKTITETKFDDEK